MHDKLKNIMSIKLFKQTIINNSSIDDNGLYEVIDQLENIIDEIVSVKEYDIAQSIKLELEEIKGDLEGYALLTIVDTQLRNINKMIDNFKPKLNTPEERMKNFRKPCESKNCNGFLYIDSHFDNIYLQCSSGVYEHKSKLTKEEKYYIFGSK